MVLAAYACLTHSTGCRRSASREVEPDAVSATAAPASFWRWGQQGQQASTAHGAPPPALGGQPPGEAVSTSGRGFSTPGSVSQLTKGLLRGKLGGSTDSVSSAGTTPGTGLPVSCCLAYLTCIHCRPALCFTAATQAPAAAQTCCGRADQAHVCAQPPAVGWTACSNA